MSLLGDDGEPAGETYGQMLQRLRERDQVSERARQRALVERQSSYGKTGGSWEQAKQQSAQQTNQSADTVPNPKGPCCIIS